MRERTEQRARRAVKAKAYALLLALLLLLGLAGHSIAHVSGDAEYVAAAGQQSLYRLDVAKARGTIFDCKLRPLTGSKKQWVAAVAPTIEAVGALEKATGGSCRERLALALEDGKPFALTLDKPLEHECVDMFSVARRYEEDMPAPHVVGYLDGQGEGAAGVELAMNDALALYQGEIAVYYHVDAMGRVIAGDQRAAVNTMEEAQGGVAVTLDKEIQQMAEEASAPLGRGAVVITQAPECRIRALVSLPDFDPNQLGQASQSQDSPLVNRAFCAYAPGSVFKLVTAAAELEGGSLPLDFECTGALNADGLLFHCYDGQAHGRVDLAGAIEKSCNCYFISAARAMGGQPVLGLAYNLGLGTGQEFGRGLFTAPGSLPQGSSLQNPRALANFSFGQGDLTVTPVQMCGLMNAIASDGVYQSPKLIEGLVSGGELAPQSPVTDVTRQAMSRNTARRLCQYLVNAAKRGTGKKGAPEGVLCGIKTGTAQTGAYENGEELSHFWYCGFVEAEDGARYCVTVLKESAAGGEEAAQVFREIAERLAGGGF